MWLRRSRAKVSFTIDPQPVIYERVICGLLARYASSMVGFYENGCGAFVRTEYPDLTYPLIFVVGHGYTAHDWATGDVRRDLRHCFVAGMHTGPAAVGTDGWSACVQVNLTPAGARRLLGLDLACLVEQVVDMQDILGRAVDELEDKLCGAIDWAKRLDLVSGFLERRIYAAQVAPDRSEYALDRLIHARGQLRIGELAAEVNCSVKHLNTLFQREVGVSPKTAASIARFNATQKQFRLEPNIDLATLAALNGFSDQAHMTHDFKRFTGHSPGAWRAAVS